MTRVGIHRQRCVTRRRRAAAGQSMVEYLIILPTLLLLVLGAVQFGLLYQIKTQLNYATFNAARQGSLKGGSNTAMKDALAAGMSPLFTNAPTVAGMLRGRAVGAIEAFNPLVTKIERISPPDSVMEDFGVADPLDAGKKLLPNDNLQYRGTDAGKKSKLNIQDANILKIRVTYCAKMVVPIANLVIYSMVTGVEGLTDIGGHLFRPATISDDLPKDLSCAQIHHRYGDKIIDVTGSIDSVLGTSIQTEVVRLLNEINRIISTNIPILNWSVGGYRIPVSSEAVVRMQSPLRQ